MAIYEYYCKTCNHVYEAMRPMSRSTESFTCPECKGEAVKTLSLFSAVVGGDGASLHSAMCRMEAQGGGTCACGTGACQAAV